MRTERVLAIALLVLTATVASGCDLLYSAAGVPGAADPYASFGPEPPHDPNSSEDPGYAEPSPIATYTSGKATYSIDGGAPVVLQTLSAGPHLYRDFGLNVVWQDGKGSYITIGDYDDGLGGSATLALDRIADGQHWTTFESDPGCVVTFSKQADATGVAGSATCHGLRWSDIMALGNSPTGGTSYVPGQEPFDLEVTFSAS